MKNDDNLYNTKVDSNRVSQGTVNKVSIISKAREISLTRKGLKGRC